MEMRPVKSTNVKAIGYDAASNTLRVEFASGSYDYDGVTAKEHRDLVDAKSIGSHFHKHFRSREHKRVPEKAA